jgi:hypothetical protein
MAMARGWLGGAAFDAAVSDVGVHVKRVTGVMRAKLMTVG